MGTPAILAAEASVDAGGTALRPGDVVDLALRVVSRADAVVDWPDAAGLQAALGDGARLVGEPKARAPVPATGRGLPAGALEHEAELRVQLLVGAGPHELGPLRVSATTATGAVEDAHVPAVRVVVTSVLDELALERLELAAASGSLREAAVGELSPVRGPWLLAPRGASGAVAAAGGLTLLALLALALWGLRRARARSADGSPRPRPPLPADVEARLRLEGLRALLARGEVEAFHVELAEIVKRYVGRRTGLDLRELTTAEVRRALEGTSRGRGVPAAEVLSVLAGCDLVKFARDVPGREGCLARLRAVEEVVALQAAPPPREGGAGPPSAGGPAHAVPRPAGGGTSR